MESLAPTLNLIVHLRLDLQQGIAVYDSLQNFCMESKPSELVIEVKNWLTQFENGVNLKEKTIQGSIFRKSLFQLMNEGLHGVSIYENLYELEKMTIQECRRNLEEAAMTLPYLGLAPLMLLMFPALLILILSPIFREFLEVLK